jgi:hypothetical protein
MTIEDYKQTIGGSKLLNQEMIHCKKWAKGYIKGSKRLYVWGVKVGKRLYPTSAASILSS